VTLALATIGEANQLLRTSYPTTLDEIERLQNQLRVLVRDVTAMAALPMPSPVQLENPLFAVIGNLFDYRTAGLKEFFFLAIAIFLDLGDIVGYTLVPNKAKDRKRRAWIPRRHTEVAPAFEVTSLPTRKDAVPDELPFEEPKFPAAGSGGKWV
jgi:hypothetical protein